MSFKKKKEVIILACLQFEVILVNLLQHNNPVNRGDIYNYCNIVRERTLGETGDFLYFDIDDFAIEKALRLYGDILREDKGEYFLKKLINLDYFNNRLDEKTRDILEETAKHLKEGV